MSTNHHQPSTLAASHAQSPSELSFSPIYRWMITQQPVPAVVDEVVDNTAVAAQLTSHPLSPCPQWCREVGTEQFVQRDRRR